jgi:hypothetical protein
MNDDLFDEAEKKGLQGPEVFAYVKERLRQRGSPWKPERDEDFDLRKPGTLLAILIIGVILFFAFGAPGCETSDPCDRCSHLTAEEGFDCFMECSEPNSPPYPQEVQ